MKVICINNKDHVNQLCPRIEVGDIVTVLSEKEYDGLTWYEFVEYPPILFEFEWCRLWYAAKNFATLPDTTEEIATEHEQEAIIYQR